MPDSQAVRPTSATLTITVEHTYGAMHYAAAVRITPDDPELARRITTALHEELVLTASDLAALVWGAAPSADTPDADTDVATTGS